MSIDSATVLAQCCLATSNYLALLIGVHGERSIEEACILVIQSMHCSGEGYHQDLTGLQALALNWWLTLIQKCTCCTESCSLFSSMLPIQDRRDHPNPPFWLVLVPERLLEAFCTSAEPSCATLAACRLLCAGPSSHCASVQGLAQKYTSESSTTMRPLKLHGHCISQQMLRRRCCCYTQCSDVTVSMPGQRDCLCGLLEQQQAAAGNLAPQA